MKTKLTLAIAMGLLLSSFTALSASITFHDDLDVDSVNGVIVEFQREVDLGQGLHFLEISYSDLFQDNADDSGYWVKSEPLYLRLDVQGSETYHLDIPELYSADDAKDFIQNPIISLTTDGNNYKDITLLSQSQLFTLLLHEK